MQSLFTATPEGRKIKTQFQQKVISDSNQFIKSLGINLNDLKSIISKHHEESKSIIEKARSVESSLESAVGSAPTEVVTENPDSPWHSIHPPYFFGYGERYGSHTGSAETFGERVFHNEDHFTGEISCLSQNFIYHGDDHAEESTEASSGMLIYFQMPATGRLNIWSQILCIESRYIFSLTNWAGWSDATVSQSSNYYMSVGEQLGLEEAYFQLFYLARHTDKNVDFAENIAMPGETKAFHFTTDSVYPAGQWILMKVWNIR